MNTCPCGCGKRLGALQIGKRGAAKGAAETSQFLTMLASRIDISVLSSVDRREYEVAVADLGRIRDCFLEHVHGQARPGKTPDVLELAQQLSAFRAGFAFGGE